MLPLTTKSKVIPPLQLNEPQKQERGLDTCSIKSKSRNSSKKNLEKQNKNPSPRKLTNKFESNPRYQNTSQGFRGSFSFENKNKDANDKFNKTNYAGGKNSKVFIPKLNLEKPLANQQLQPIKDDLSHILNKNAKNS